MDKEVIDAILKMVLTMIVIFGLALFMGGLIMGKLI